MRRGTMRRGWLYLAAMLGVAVLGAPTGARAQTWADALAVQTAIRAELARPGSGIAPESVIVSFIRFEGEFATANIAGSNFDAPIVFVKNTDSRWMVVFVGTETTPEDCRHVGFHGNSQMCPN